MKTGIYYTAITFLLTCLILSLTAYLWVPDPSQYSNRQLPEASLFDPGQRICYTSVLIKESGQHFFSRLISGNKSLYKLNVQPEQPENQESVHCITFLFGSDKFGRDVFSRIMVGLRYTLFIGFAAVLVSLLLGLILGSLSGYFGGVTDQIISVLINVFWSLPTILLAFAVILSFGRSMTSIFIAIALTMWGDVARLVRAQVLSVKESLFVQAGRSLGFSHFNLLFRQILPNILGPVWVAAAGNFALAVLLESGLSFLGFGLQPPIPTIGNILQEQYAYAVTGKPLLALIPSIVVVLLVLAFQIITNELRDKTDVRLSMIK